jgi:hypothetical protein
MIFVRSVGGCGVKSGETDRCLSSLLILVTWDGQNPNPWKENSLHFGQLYIFLYFECSRIFPDTVSVLTQVTQPLHHPGCGYSRVACPF